VEDEEDEEEHDDEEMSPRTFLPGSKRYSRATTEQETCGQVKLCVFGVK
jgi:hypothetical protein